MPGTWKSPLDSVFCPLVVIGKKASFGLSLSRVFAYSIHTSHAVLTYVC